MKVRDICEFFLNKTDESLVRNRIFKKLLEFEAKNQLQCMNINENINFSCANLQMEYELISIFEKICDKNLYSEYMSTESKMNNATLIFYIAIKIDKIGVLKLTEDSYNWFKKQMIESMLKSLNCMTLFNEFEWDDYLVPENDNRELKYGEAIVYGLLTLWTIKTVKKLITDILI